jgi:hypothetical protein
MKNFSRLEEGPAFCTWLQCSKVHLMCAEIWYLVVIEAMHLLPQSFEFRRSNPPPMGRL